MDNSHHSQSAYPQGMGQEDQPYRIDLNNYVPDPNKKHELKRRLYDSGISNVPMASVKRPIEEKISSQPFSARMNSSKIQSLSPLKKEIQQLNTNIISHLNESYKQAAIQEAKYQGEGTADYYRSQQVVIPVPADVGMSQAGRKLQGSLGVSMQPRMTSQLLNTRKAAQMQPLDADYQRQAEIKLQAAADPDKIMAGPPSLVYAGFEGGVSMSQKNLELARSKFLLDKLTGKLPAELRRGRLPPMDDTRSQGRLAEAEAQGGQVTNVQPQVFTGQEGQDEHKPQLAQKWSDLDKYIELLLDSKSEEETVFMYLDAQNNGDPYDLQVVSYLAKSTTKYYTLSGKGLTLYENDVPVEFISLGQWLIERDSYNHIKELSFFKQFNKWKFMRMWKKTIKHNNRMKAKNALEEKLFMLQPHFRDHLAHHRRLMIEMQHLKFVDICRGDVKSIDEFEESQDFQRKKVERLIRAQSVKAHDNITKCTQKVLTELRNRIVSEITLDEERKRNNPIQSSNAATMKRKEASDAFDRLGFPAGMTYGHRSSLRKECSRFLRFAYLVDFLTMESLANIYTHSVIEMIDRLDELDDHGIEKLEDIMVMDFDDAQGNGQAQRGYEPLFYLQVTLNDRKPIPPSEIVEQPIDDFAPDPRGTSQDHDYDLFAHMDFEKEKTGDEEEEEPEADGEPEAVAPTQLYKQTLPNVQNFWIELKPDKQEFQAKIIDNFERGLEKIQCFTRWGKSAALKQFADVLEEWDDIVGDSWDEQEILTLNPIGWINDTDVFKTKKERVDNLVSMAYDKAQHFLKRFQPILEIYWRNKQFDIECLTDEKLKNPIETIGQVMKLFKYFQGHFQSNLPATTDIGMLQLDSKEIKTKLQPTPKQFNDDIELLLPRVSKGRVDNAKEWLVQSIRDLQMDVNNVAEFVIQCQHHAKITDKFQTVRDKVDLYSQVYQVVEANGMQKLKKEDEQNLKEAKNQINTLSQIVQNVEQSMETANEKFKKQLEQLIPQLNDDVVNLVEESVDEKYLDSNQSTIDMIKELDEKMERFNELEKRSAQYNSWQEVLGVPPTIFDNLDDLKVELSARHQLWHSLQEWKDLSIEWSSTQFGTVDAPEIAKMCEKYSKITSRVGKILPENEIQAELQDNVNTFTSAMPIVTSLRNVNLTDTHWEEIRSIVGPGLDIGNDDFTLQSLLEMNVVQYQEDIVGISVRASGEHKLRTQLNDLIETWKTINFIVKPHKDKQDAFVLAELDTIFGFLDEGQATINMILGNRFVKAMRQEAENFRKSLLTLSNAVEEWKNVQQQWIYLENVFQAPDIKKYLGPAAQKFEQVDKFFKGLMQKTQKTSQCMRVIKININLVQQLQENNKSLDEITKALQEYMERKRSEFPRFYFLSDDELLDILANSDKVSEVIMLHLKTLFDNLVFLDISEGEIFKMHSREKEVCPFVKPVKLKSEVQAWLLDVQKEMCTTIQRRMKEGYKAYTDGGRKAWVQQHPGQIVAAVAQIMWSAQSEEAINLMVEDRSSLETWKKQNDEQLKGLTELVRSNLTELDRCIIVALITTDVHARDIVEEMRRAGVASVYDFNWQKQLRYYFISDDGPDGSVKIRQIQAELNYGLEYMGAASRLVITPLTDRCWITISGALHIKLGANPSGPAGTGKTESTKDLAKASATLCIVFNCSDQVDYIMMARLFSGLCQQGAWTCLDEFNRIGVEVLSVIAQQLQQIREALLQGKATEDGKFTFVFSDKQIPLRPAFGCHVTMNPGYAGRTELPDNLKVLFRPVSMMIPNYGLIAEIMLFAEGFGNGTELSKKMVQLYKLSSEQLSQQQHYDFGMRAVKSVLVMAGALKRANMEMQEDAVLIRAMRDANVPKFLKDDLPLFAAIIQDLFPTVEIINPDYSQLMIQIKKSILKLGWQTNENFVQKIIYLYETFNVRFGVMLVGPTGGAKTSCYNVLADVMTTLREENHPDKAFQKVTKQILNPKAISMGQLYGEVDYISQEWTDGLASKVMRGAAQDTSDEKHWTVFDGPVDAIWIENMNTVLDDNMTLCLANGQRIKLRPQMRMLFEVNDLAVASPATVSRCGMVYMTQEELGWEPYVQTWMQVHFPDEEILSKEMQTYMMNIFLDTMDAGIDKIRNNPQFKEPVKTDNLQLVKGTCNFLQAMLKPEMGFKGDDKQKRKDLDSVFAWSFAWGMGAGLDEKSKDFFDSLVKELFKTASFPPALTVFDYYYDLKKEKTWKEWQTRVEKFEYVRDSSYFDLMVPTADTYKHRYCLETLLNIGKNVFFTGLTGVGKSATITNSLIIQTQNTNPDKDTLQPVYLNFSAQTKADRAQDNIIEKLEKKSRMSFGAKPAHKVAIFVDDINMPLPEEWGAAPPIELLRMLVNMWGVYDRDEWEWKAIEDSTMIAACAPPGGGRADLTQRFTTNFNIFCMPVASPQVLAKIFSSILDGFLKGGFQEAVQSCSNAIIEGTIEIYTKMQEGLRATPAKFHYMFNLRDVSKVIQGILMCSNKSVQSAETMQKLWANEASRVFQDRLINQTDNLWYTDLIMDILSRSFRSALTYDDLFGEKKVMFSDILKLEATVRLYEEIKDPIKLNKALQDFLEDYNASNAIKMNLVFFEDAVLHLIKILRTLRQPRGNIMCIGVGGSGKQSLIKLSSHVYSMVFRQIEIVKGFNDQSFREFIKELMFDTGINPKNIATSFTMTDSQILSETFLEDINNVLNTGEIPNLLLAEDKDKIQNDVRPIVLEMKLVDNPDTLAKVFVDRVRTYLHICLCMSPVGDDLRVRCRKFPSLVNCCTLDWFSAWPEEALLYVSRSFLKEVELPSDNLREALAQICSQVHTSVDKVSEKFWDELRRRVYTTPKSYLDLINLYKNQLGKKRNEMNANKNRLANGLKKLENTNQNIAELKITLDAMKPQLEASNIKLKETLEVVNRDKAIADEKERLAMIDQQVVQQKAAEAKIVKDDADEDLARALPILKKAKQIVDGLDKSAVGEIKAYAAPPAPVVMTMEACVTIFGEKDIKWESIKKVIMDPGKFVARVQQLDVESVSESIWKKVRDKWFKMPGFKPELVTNVSQAAGKLCEWALALSEFQIINKNIIPKKKKAAEMDKILSENMAILNKTLAEVKAVKDKVAALEASANSLLAEKDRLEKQMARDTARMGRAEKLVVLLADEGIRWKDTVATQEIEIGELVGNVFLSCACISYFGAFTGTYRKMLTDEWTEMAIEKEIPCSPTFTLSGIMGDPVVIRGWNIEGLPTDNTSSENGILTTSAERWGLCIDPQQQAFKWLRAMYKQQKLCQLKFGKTTFLREIEAAVQNGRPVLIEDVLENIDPGLDPILMHSEFAGEGGIMQIKLGDSIKDFDMDFRLYMTSKLPNPHYPPEVCIKVTLINFTVTAEGLEEQLLGDVVVKEKPEVEAKSVQIVMQMADDKKTLKNIENNILKMLAESTIEQILDQDDLINVLDQSKITSAEINERIADAVVVEKEINETRQGYTQVAVRGSVLYFVIADMGNINDMYQNSLEYVKVLFNKAIDTTVKSDVLETRLQSLIDTITRQVYTNISRGLFERDKIIFSFLACTSIMREKKLIDNVAWSLLLRGSAPVTDAQKAKILPNPMPKNVLTDLNHQYLYSAEINMPDVFGGLLEDMLKENDDWLKWATCESPQTEALPGEWDAKLDDFLKLIIIKAFRSEKLSAAFQIFVLRNMGKFYTEPPPVTMEIVYADTDERTPMVFILSTGADPTNQLYKFAKQLGQFDDMAAISLGQGQDVYATKAIEDAKREGKWVLLQNCHLMKSWMNHLEAIVLDFKECEGMHEKFRLFLTSMPVGYFPVSTLQNSVKMTTEPPRGIRANLKRTFAEFSQSFLDDVKKPDIWRKLVFGISFFHSIVQERRKFGPLGWNILYEFNDSDLETSLTMLRIFLDEQDDIPWDALLYVTGHINYGGRVTDDNDRRCLLTTLEKYYCIENLEDNYPYSPSGLYYAPQNCSIEQYRDYIDKLPLQDAPEVFGLHENANIMYQQQDSDKFVNTVLSIQPRVSSAGGGMTPDEVVLERISQLQEQIPESLDREEGKKEMFKATNGLLPSLTTVLLQEMEKFNRLLGAMRGTLRDLKDAIHGFIVMTEMLDVMYLSLQNNVVPPNWAKVGYPSLKPLASWFADLLRRVGDINSWLIDGIPKSFWISGMFFPQGFMTGCLQTHARHYKIAIDQLSFSFMVMTEESVDEIEEYPEDGCYVHGFYMDGARYNREEAVIDEQAPGELYDLMPLIWLKPVIDYERNPDEYACPCYKTGVRAGVLSTTGQSTNFIIHMDIPTNVSPAVWTRRACAMLCQLND